MKPQVAPLAARKGLATGGIAIAAAIAGALFLLSRSGGSGRASTPSGSLGSITLSQSINKGLTQSIRVEARINFATKDFNGNPIDWPYFVLFRLYNQNNQQMDQAQFMGVVFGNESELFSFEFTPFPGKLQIGDTLRLKVELNGANSDSQGRPVSPISYRPLADVTPDDRINVIADSIGSGLVVVDGPRIFQIHPTGISGLSFTWSGTVRNDGSTIRYFRPMRTATQSGIGPILREQSMRTIQPGQTLAFSSNTNTGSRVFGETWVRETTSTGNYIKDLPPRVAYDIF